jgi:hypothetical protein
MGANGSKVQKITTDFNVQIKFPDKAVENGGETLVVTKEDRLVWIVIAQIQFYGNYF